MSTLRTDTLQTTDSSFSILVSDLANSAVVAGKVNTSDIIDTSATKGAALIARATQAVTNIAALRELSKLAPSKFASVQGHTVAGDGGNGDYYYDAADTTSAENLPFILVANDGGRWKLLRTPALDLTQVGADKTGVADSTVAIQRALTLGNAFKIPDGTYRLNGQVVSDYTGISYPGTSFPSNRVDFLGTSIANTMFEMNTGVAVGLKFIGDSPVSGGQGIHSMDRIGNFSVYAKNRPYPTGQTGLGLYLVNKAYTRVENLSTEYLSAGIQLDGVLSSDFSNIYLRNGIVGLVANSTALSLPNANTFSHLISAGNSQAGAIFNTMGAGNVFIGGSIENNGTQSVAGNGGLIANLSGANGTACLSMDGTYFEGNAGDADLRLDNISALPITVHLKGCLFNRTSNTRYVTSNITVTSTGGGPVKVILDACSFWSTGTYVPSNARPYIQYGSGVEIIGWDTCTFNESVSIQTVFNSASSAVLSGWVVGSGAINNAPPGTSVSRVAAGLYDVTRTGGWSSSTTGFNVFVQPISATLETKTAFVTKTSNTNFRVAFRNSLADPAYVDTDFMFMVCRVQ